MERQMERRRESEPLTMDTMVEGLWQFRDAEKQKTRTLPRVLKGKDIPWVQNAQTYYHGFIRPGLMNRLKQGPIFTMMIAEQMVFPAHKSGRHRHYYEAIFYTIDGEGYEIHDNKRWDWATGDVMTVPTFCIHQHFNSRADKPAHFLFSTPNFAEFMGVGNIEQMEINENYQIPEGAEPFYNHQGEMLGYKLKDGTTLSFGRDEDLQKMMEARRAKPFDAQPKDTYEYYLKLLTEQTKWRDAVSHVIKDKDRPWENTRFGRVKYFVSPAFPGGLMLYDCFTQEIPPGSRSGKHTHVSEEVHFILEGKGYDVHDGVRHDWEKGDLVCIPINTTHQHFNSDPRNPAKYVAIQSRLYHYIGHGGFHHLEDCPEYRV